MKEWLSRKEACDYLGISMPTLNRYMSAGKITYYKSSVAKSGKVRFKLSDLINYLKSIKK